MIPLTIGTAEQFRLLRCYLQRANYTEAAICERVGIDSIFEFRTVYENRTTGIEIEDELGALIHLFMDGERLEAARLAGLLSGDVVELMEGLGLLGSIEDDPGTPRFATALLYPVAGLYAASDRTTPANPKKPVQHPRDVVYAAITGNTGRFLAAQPPIPCEDFLDLCSGTGIAAMVAGARYARHAWACDITERSVHFSEFNCRLNGLDNVTPAQGDLYEATGDRTFDRIVAHPPYIPSKTQEWVFRDGGVDGEQILRRVIEGLPQYLRPQGRFYCVTLATDREGETFEERIRRWLGPAESEFDVVLSANEVRGVSEELRVAAARRKIRRRQLEETERLLAELKVTGTFYGAVAIRRKTESRRAATARVVKSPQAGAEATEWVLQFETAALREGFDSSLLASRPQYAPGMKLVVSHTPAEGGLIPSEFAVKAEHPFIVDGACAQWVAVAVTWCDGSRTARQILDELRGQQVVSDEFAESDFVDVLRLLVRNGVLVLNEFPLPPAGTPQTGRV